MSLEISAAYDEILRAQQATVQTYFNGRHEAKLMRAVSDNDIAMARHLFAMSKHNFIDVHLLSECIKADALDCFDYFVERRPQVLTTMEICTSLLANVSKWGRYRFLDRFRPWLLAIVLATDRFMIIESGLESAVTGGHYGMIDWYKSLPNEEGIISAHLDKRMIPGLIMRAMTACAAPKDPGPKTPYVEAEAGGLFETSIGNYDLAVLQIQQQKKRRAEYHETEWRRKIDTYETGRVKVELEEAARFHLVDRLCREMGEDHWLSCMQHALFLGTYFSGISFAEQVTLEPTNLKLWHFLRQVRCPQKMVAAQDSLPVVELEGSEDINISRDINSQTATYATSLYGPDPRDWKSGGGCIFYGLERNVPWASSAAPTEAKESPERQDQKNPRLHLLHAAHMPVNPMPDMYGTLLARALISGMSEFAKQIMQDGYARPCYQMLSIASESASEGDRLECCAAVLDAGELTVFANPPWVVASQTELAAPFPKNTWREVIHREPVMRALGAKEQREHFAMFAVEQLCAIVPHMNRDVGGLIAMYFLGTTGARLSAIRAWISRLTGRPSLARNVPMVVEPDRPILPPPYLLHRN